MLTKIFSPNQCHKIALSIWVSHRLCAFFFICIHDSCASLNTFFSRRSNRRGNSWLSAVCEQLSWPLWSRSKLLRRNTWRCRQISLFNEISQRRKTRKSTSAERINSFDLFFQRKLLAIYLHHDRSVLSNVFCGQLLNNENIIKQLTDNYVLYGWDLTCESNKNLWVSQP